MVVHIVFWKLREDGEESKEQRIQTMKEKLEALVGIVPGLLSAEVGKNYNGGEYDICLFSHLKDRAALEGYAVHPEHLKAAEDVRASTCGRTAVDYDSDSELEDPVDPYSF